MCNNRFECSAVLWLEKNYLWDENPVVQNYCTWNHQLINHHFKHRKTQTWGRSEMNKHTIKCTPTWRMQKMTQKILKVVLDWAQWHIKQVWQCLSRSESSCAWGVAWLIFAGIETWEKDIIISSTPKAVSQGKEKKKKSPEREPSYHDFIKPAWDAEVWI